MAVTIKRDGYGQLEPNHLSAPRTGQVYGQLPANEDIKILEQGMFVKYDYAAGECNFDGDGPWMLVFNEEKLYDEQKQMHKHFALKAEDFYDGKMYPRCLVPQLGDIMTTNMFADNTSLKVGDVVSPGADGILAIASGDVEYTVVFTDESHSFDNGICTVCSTKEDYTIKITNGIVAKGEKEIYHVGDIVTLKADEPEEGKVFAYWKDGNGNVLSTKANYSFVVLQSVDLTAVYNNEHTAESILNISAVQTSSNGKNAIRFVFNRSVDTKAQVEEVGLIYATNKLAGYTDGAKVNLSESDFDIETALKDNTNGKVKTYKGTSTSINGTIRLTYTIGNNTDCYVYAYGYVKLTDGTTLYTDLLATTYDSIV